MNDEAPNAYNQATNAGARRENSPDPVSIGIENDTELVLTNPSRPLGDYDPDNVSNEPLPIVDTNIPIDRESLLPWAIEVNGNARE
jgi:hypothetical protein